MKSAVEKFVNNHPITGSQATVLRLKEIDSFCQNLAKAADADHENRVGDDPWKQVFQMVFTSKLAQTVRLMFKTLNIHFDWVDPDTTYEEDARAFIDALHERMSTIDVSAIAPSDHPNGIPSPVTRLTKGYGNQKTDGTHMVDLIDSINGNIICRCVYEPYADQILEATKALFKR